MTTQTNRPSYTGSRPPYTGTGSRPPGGPSTGSRTPGYRPGGSGPPGSRAGGSGPPGSRPGGGRPGGGGPGGGRFAGRGGGRRGRPRYYSRRKICGFCVDHIEYIDYKETEQFRRYMTDRWKIESRRKTGVCSKHQRGLANAIKRARHLALIPFSPDHDGPPMRWSRDLPPHRRM